MSENENNNNNIPGIPTKEIGELLDSVSDKVPKLLKNVMDAMYGAETGINMGKAVGGFYKELVESGLPPELAAKMAEKYMISISDIVDNAMPNRGKEVNVEVD